MNWKPAIKEGNFLTIKEETLLGNSVTSINDTEGGAIEIVQIGFKDDNQYVILDRNEIKNLIFNFMSNEELIDIVYQKNLRESLS